MNHHRILSGCAIAMLAAGCQEASTVGSYKSAKAMIDVTQTEFIPAPQVFGWPGLALFDYDNDGDIDVFVTNTRGLKNMFYQNDGLGNFEYYGSRAGLALEDESCVSAGVGDFDNDGWLDLIIGRQPPFFGTFETNVSLMFMKNMGPDEEGIVRFEDVTDQTGLAGVTYASSIGVGDIDNDGLLDLYVGRYDLADLDFSLISFLPDTPNVLMRNTGVVDGVPVFEDITESAGVAGTRVAGVAADTADIMNRVPTWAVYMSDVNEDGLLDIFSLQEIPGGVDLFINNGDLTFTLVLEDLLNRHGGWMGATAADVDRDGHLDYFLANVGGDAKGPPDLNNIGSAWKLERGWPYHRLLKNDGSGNLVDIASTTSVTPGTLPPTNILEADGLAAYEFGFGCAFFDMENDGWPDLHWVGDLILSGLVRSGALRVDFHGVGRFLSNNGDGSFTDQTAERGLFNWADSLPLAYGYSRPGRALAAIDLNGDGFSDICRTSAFADPAITEAFGCLMNAAAEDGHWLTVRLKGTRSNAFGIGSRVEAMADGTMFVGEVITTTSAFTAVHPQVHFGLGSLTMIDSLTIRWPSGAVSELSDVSVDQVLTVTEP
jgi:enediyne biosynthesis protein E4